MTAPSQATGGVLGLALARVVRGYQLAVSPLMAPHCRYWPSCSEYAIEALRGHGVLRGGWLAARRLCRCHPWSAGGVDLVPAPVGEGTAAVSSSSLSIPSLSTTSLPTPSLPTSVGQAAGHNSLIESSRSPDVIGATGSRSSYARRAASSARTPIPD